MHNIRLYLSFQWRDFFLNLCPWPNERLECPKWRILILMYDYIDFGVWLFWRWCMIILIMVKDYTDFGVWLYWFGCMIILMLVYDYINVGVWLYLCWCMIILILLYDYIDVGVWLYWCWCMIILMLCNFKLHIYFPYTLFLKLSSHFSSIDVTTLF